MNKKALMALVAVLVIGGGAAGFVLTRKDDEPKSSTNTTSSTEEKDESPSEDSSEQSELADLGLCDILNVATIKSALGEVAASVTTPNNTGVVSLGDGDKGQTCVYPFVADGSASNSFYIDLATYSAKSFDLISSFTASSGTPVSGVGDKAVFESTDDTGIGTTEYTITAVKGTNVYLFVISQPKDSATFTDDSALSALTTIAQSAELF